MVLEEFRAAIKNLRPLIPLSMLHRSHPGRFYIDLLEAINPITEASLKHAIHSALELSSELEVYAEPFISLCQCRPDILVFDSEGRSMIIETKLYYSHYYRKTFNKYEFLDVDFVCQAGYSLGTSRVAKREGIIYIGSAESALECERRLGNLGVASSIGRYVYDPFRGELKEVNPPLRRDIRAPLKKEDLMFDDTYLHNLFEHHVWNYYIDRGYLVSAQPSLSIEKQELAYIYMDEYYFPYGVSFAVKGIRRPDLTAVKMNELWNPQEILCFEIKTWVDLQGWTRKVKPQLIHYKRSGYFSRIYLVSSEECIERVRDMVDEETDYVGLIAITSNKKLKIVEEAKTVGIPWIPFPRKKILKIYYLQ